MVGVRNDLRFLTDVHPGAQCRHVQFRCSDDQRCARLAPSVARRWPREGDGVFEGKGTAAGSHGGRPLGRLDAPRPPSCCPSTAALAAVAEFSRATVEPDCAIRLCSRGGGSSARNLPAPRELAFSPSSTGDPTAHGVEDAVVRGEHAGEPACETGRMWRGPFTSDIGVSPRPDIVVLRIEGETVVSLRSSSACLTCHAAAGGRGMRDANPDDAGRRTAGTDGALLVSTVMEARPTREVAGVAT